jgi:hypothetical protein
VCELAWLTSRPYLLSSLMHVFWFILLLLLLTFHLALSCMGHYPNRHFITPQIAAFLILHP